ncbi:MAG: GatB/YqeY domain-containing protein [Kofleriaceae bacterium]|nr:GatB/YqeY domain-containing protein [Kofleriaceae bacterium]
MSIEADLKTKLIAAMKAKDAPTANVVKMLRSKIGEKRTSKGFTGDITDAHCLEIIAAYKKSLEKARVEFEKAGEKGLEPIAELNHDIEFCKQFLPQPMSEADVRVAVKEAIAGMGEVSANMAGRIVGMVMKAHKGVAEASLVKRIVGEELS